VYAWDRRPPLGTQPQEVPGYSPGCLTPEATA